MCREKTLLAKGVIFAPDLLWSFEKQLASRAGNFGPANCAIELSSLL